MTDETKAEQNAGTRPTRMDSAEYRLFLRYVMYWGSVSFFGVALGAPAVPLGWPHACRDELRELQDSRVGLSAEERTVSAEGIIDRNFGRWGRLWK